MIRLFSAAAHSFKCLGRAYYGTETVKYGHHIFTNFETSQLYWFKTILVEDPQFVVSTYKWSPYKWRKISNLGLRHLIIGDSSNILPNALFQSYRNWNNECGRLDINDDVSLFADFEEREVPSELIERVKNLYQSIPSNIKKEMDVCLRDDLGIHASWEEKYSNHKISFEHDELIASIQ